MIRQAVAAGAVQAVQPQGGGFLSGEKLGLSGGNFGKFHFHDVRAAAHLWRKLRKEGRADLLKVIGWAAPPGVPSVNELYIAHRPPRGAAATKPCAAAAGITEPSAATARAPRPPRRQYLLPPPPP